MPGKPSIYFAALLLLLSTAAWAQQSQPLPQAPAPQRKAPSLPEHVPGATRYNPSKWDLAVDPGEKVPPLYPRDKMVYWLHQEINPIGWAPGLLATGWEQLIVGDPDYGSDSAAYGERVGAAVIRDTSMRFFTSSLVPTLTHEDPRYFRKGHGPIKARGVYAAESVLFTQRDDGTRGFNYSDTVGHLAASALTPTYYPAPSANTRVVFTTWVLSLAGDAGGKLFLEFWPDAARAIQRRRHRAR